MKYLIAAVFVLSASLCMAQEWVRSSPGQFLPGEVGTSVVDMTSQYKNEGASHVCRYQLEIKESGTYYVAFGTTTRRRTAYCKGYYATQKIEGVVGEVISGTISCKAPDSEGFYQGPNGPEYVIPHWIIGAYKDPKDIRAGDYWRD